ncbi:MFS transporter permease [Clostridium sp.]|uniref:MFS transporter permease n=1 Tax=Clostridium sp. TaxID=1506 RepID=UPI002FC9CEEE
MKKSYIVMLSMFLIALGVISKAFILNEGIKLFLLVFFIVGCGLGLLRLFVNNSIKKMKGKNWSIKILFFAVLLGVGLPFQSWFRTKVLFSMNSEYLPRSIFILITGIIFMTTFFVFIKDKMAKSKL